tara:strand:- start:31215 stop:31952 length:738 start_codon:yes stop_codon:yes gene_type:complete
MDRVIYDRMAEYDSVHWWYRGRRKILAKYIERSANLTADARILEIGCGTGHNLAMLGQFGSVDAIEIDRSSRIIASRRLGQPVLWAPLPELSGIERGGYDLIAVLDVLEHIKDDVAALQSIADCLKPGGKILITVPAHQWMWTGHDAANHHYRRYSRASLAKSLQAAGLRGDRLNYMNSLLFPLAVASRLHAKLTGKEGSDDAMLPKPINSLLETIFSLERHSIGRIQLLPGLSLATLAVPVSSD